MALTLKTVVSQIEQYGASSCGDLAALLGVTPKDMIAFLSDAVEHNELICVNGLYAESGGKRVQRNPAKQQQNTVKAHQSPAKPEIKATKMPNSATKPTVGLLRELLAKHGDMTAAELGQRTKIEGRMIGPMLANDKKAGRITLVERSGKNYYHMVKEGEAVQPRSETQNIPKTISAGDAAKDIAKAKEAVATTLNKSAIPSHMMELIVPTPEFLALELRRLRSEVRRVEALKKAVSGAVRQLAKGGC
ncbi:hypothetical protein [Hafnia alvei]|uniref:hypothetical protein n=1 Tax=Hafnia alvei TaxID=569 RepID=UPI0006227B2F|nr:hypothetical protein [Hafnia alvei]KKI45232.1 hypothetical protein XK86_09165 [Hafnia alvei]MDU7480793.1 hypothetical protein [Hafnia alvei]